LAVVKKSMGMGVSTFQVMAIGRLGA